MKRIKVLLANDFHGTAIWVNVPAITGELSLYQVRKATKALCGQSDCQCGGPAGVRPANQVEQIGYDRVKVWLN